MGLNEQYFKTRKKHQEERVRQKSKSISIGEKVKKLMLVLFLAIVVLLVQRCLNDRIEENKQNDPEYIEK